MRKHLTILILALLPFAGMAQKQNKVSEEKYLKDAVPVVDNRVVFSAEILSEGFNKDQAYEKVAKWAEKKFQPSEKLNPRVVYRNPEEGEIAATGEEYIIFKSTILSLDRTRIYYQLVVDCEDNRCLVKMSRIHYWYNEFAENESKFTAEEFIIDKYALNKKKNKTVGGCGKFRRKTIDLKDNLFNEIAKLFVKEQAAQPVIAQSVEIIQNNQPKTDLAATKEEETITSSQETTIKATPLVPAKTKAQTVSTDELIKQANRITLAANDEKIELGNDCWGGFEDFFGKKMACCLIDSQKKIGNMLMEQADEYTISFFTNTKDTPVLVIKCKKQINKTIPGTEAKQLNANCNENKSYKMYVGEVIK